VHAQVGHLATPQELVKVDEVPEDSPVHGIRWFQPPSPVVHQLLDASPFSSHQLGQSWYINPTDGSSQFGLRFDNRRDEPSVYLYFHFDSALVPRVNAAQSHNDAETISKEFSSSIGGRIHLLAAASLCAATTHQSPAWGRTGALLVIH
jgi:hypothetical protein